MDRPGGTVPVILSVVDAGPAIQRRSVRWPRVALFSVNMPCSLCREPIRVGDDIVGTTHFIGDATDPLWRYSDSVMHRRCFDAWEHRDEFARRYRQTMGAMYPHVEHYVNFPGPPRRNVVKDPDRHRRHRRTSARIATPV